jgi:hypothetical protein
MKRFAILAGAVLLLGAEICRGEDYQKTAEATAWSWSAERASVLDSLLRFPKDYQVELIRKKDQFGLTIRIVDAGKELCAWEGHYRSVFALGGDVLVYADFLPSRTGCALVAHDLKTQKQLWKTDLKGLGPIAHTRYANAVNLEVINGEVVRVFGEESAGKYLEYVDLKTGKTVGHRVYGK